MTNEQILDQQWGRAASLFVASPTGDGIDLSDLHFRFRVSNADQETPNTMVVRIYNLSPDTVRSITGRTPVEFTRVILQAGYHGTSVGVIFDGTIKQFRRGRENSVDTYLDILAASSDIEYNFGVCNQTLAAGSTPAQRIAAIASQMGLGVNAPGPYTGGVLPRGKVLWGMGRALMRCEANSQNASWSIQDGMAQVVPLAGYLPGEAVVLSAASGLIGIPEQTEQGVRARCLLNPKLRIGGLVQIDNASISQISQADLKASGFPVSSLPVGQLPYDRYAGLQLPADIAADGLYRLYVAEFEGDTRGPAWYTDIIGLALDPSSNQVMAE